MQTAAEVRLSIWRQRIDGWRCRIDDAARAPRRATD